MIYGLVMAILLDAFSKELEMDDFSADEKAKLDHLNDIGIQEDFPEESNEITINTIYDLNARYYHIK